MKFINNYPPSSNKQNSIYADIIIDKFNDLIEFKTYQRGTRFVMTTSHLHNIYIIKNGSISLNCIPDNIMLGIQSGPTIRGTIHLKKGNDRQCILKVLDQADIAIIKEDHFYTLLIQLQLWEVFARHLQLTVAALTEHFFNLISPTIQEIVYHQLLELMTEPSTVRESMTADIYIRSKTRVSRATIMRILAKLRDDENIVIENGILKSIVSLPL